MTIDDYKKQIEALKEEKCIKAEEIEKIHVKLGTVISCKDSLKELLENLKKQENSIKNFGENQKKALKKAFFIFVGCLGVLSILSCATLITSFPYFFVVGISSVLSFLTASYNYHVEMKPLKDLKRSIEEGEIDFGIEIPMIEIRYEATENLIVELQNEINKFNKELKNIEMMISKKTSELTRLQKKCYIKVENKLKNLFPKDSLENDDQKPKRKIKTPREIYYGKTKVEKMSNGTFGNIPVKSND